MPPTNEAVDKDGPHPSRRSQKKGPPQGERKLSLQNNNATARPEEPPSVGGVSKHVLNYYGRKSLRGVQKLGAHAASRSNCWMLASRVARTAAVRRRPRWVS